LTKKEVKNMDPRKKIYYYCCRHPVPAKPTQNDVEAPKDVEEKQEKMYLTDKLQENETTVEEKQ
jgi:hypothetical protein